MTGTENHLQNFITEFNNRVKRGAIRQGPGELDFMDQISHRLMLFSDNHADENIRAIEPYLMSSIC